MTNINEFKETSGKYIYSIFCNLDVLERKLHAYDLERGALEAFSNQPQLSGSALETLVKNDLGYVHTLFYHASDLFEFLVGRPNPVTLPEQKTPDESISIQDMVVYYYEFSEKLHVIFWNMAICFGGPVADKLQDPDTANTTKKMIAPESATLIWLMEQILHELREAVNISYTIGTFLYPEEEEQEDRLDAC